MTQSETYEYFRPTEQSESLKISKDLIRTIIKSINGNVLDVACGSGKLLQTLEEYPSELYGLDIKLDFNDVTRSHGILGDAMSLPFREGVFDFVTSLGLMEHLSTHTISNVLGEIRRVSSDTGHLLLVTINYYSVFIRCANFNHPGRLTFLTKSRLRTIIEDNGFVVESISNGGKFAGANLPNVIRKIINLLLPNAMSDRIIIIAKKRRTRNGS